MKSKMNALPQKFQPSIPNLIYQYNFFINYESEKLSQINPEIEMYATGKKSNIESGNRDNCKPS